MSLITGSEYKIVIASLFIFLLTITFFAFWSNPYAITFDPLEETEIITNESVEKRNLTIPEQQENATVLDSVKARFGGWLDNVAPDFAVDFVRSVQDISSRITRGFSLLILETPPEVAGVVIIFSTITVLVLLSIVRKVFYL